MPSRSGPGALALVTGLVLITAGPAPTEPLYRYDAATGTCRAADGAEGLNPVDRDTWQAERTVTAGECADLRGSARVNITYRTFEGASLRGADFTDNGCYQTEFRKSDLTGARFVNVAGNGCRFVDSDLTGVDLRGATMSGAEFRNVTLSGARFDARTRLPFSREEALTRGMVEAP